MVHLTNSFERVRTLGLTLPDVRATTRYDGAPVLKVHGVFMAGLAMHRSAEPDTLVVRAPLDDREWLLEDAPEVYYLTDYYRPYPLVLVRLATVDREACTICCRCRGGSRSRRHERPDAALSLATR